MTSRDITPRGPGPTTAAVERREASIPVRADCASLSAWDARRLARACGPTSLARERVPLHPSACRRSAPSTLGRGWNRKPRRTFCLASTIKLASRRRPGHATLPSGRRRQERVRGAMAGNGKPPEQQLAQSDCRDRRRPGRRRDFRRGAAQGRGLHRGRGRSDQPAGRLCRGVRHRHRGRDVAVPSLHGDRRRAAAVQRVPDRRDAAVALHARRVRAGAVLSPVSAVAALPQPHPVVRRHRGRRPRSRS